MVKGRFSAVFLRKSKKRSSEDSIPELSPSSPLLPPPHWPFRFGQQGRIDRSNPSDQYDSQDDSDDHHQDEHSEEPLTPVTHGVSFLDLQLPQGFSQDTEEQMQLVYEDVGKQTDVQQYRRSDRFCCCKLVGGPDGIQHQYENVHCDYNVHRIAGGSFGEIHVAREKRKLPATFSILKTFKDRCNAEYERDIARVACTANTPRVVRLLEEMTLDHLSCTDFRGTVLKYELCPFGSLYNFQAHVRYPSGTKEGVIARPLPESFIMHAARHIAEGLAFLHSGVIHRPNGIHITHPNWRPIVHQDLKPENVLVGDPIDGQRYPSLKLGDLGGAHYEDATEYFEGTTDYQPIEQDHKCSADMWSYGATLYYLALQRPPIERGPKKPSPSLYRRNRKEYDEAQEAYENRPRTVNPVNKRTWSWDQIYSNDLQELLNCVLVDKPLRFTALEVLSSGLIKEDEEGYIPLGGIERLEDKAMGNIGEWE